jgi:hypothetical protein
MRIAIMGSGGVGGYFGARLAQAGCEVAFIARGEHLAALRERGLVVESQLGDVYLPRVRATDNPTGLGPVDLVLIAVKLWDTGTMQRLVFGEYDGRRSNRAEALLAACRRAGIDAEAALRQRDMTDGLAGRGEYAHPVAIVQAHKI